jgi:hypothetical protein
MSKCWGLSGPGKIIEKAHHLRLKAKKYPLPPQRQINPSLIDKIQTFYRRENLDRRRTWQSRKEMITAA